jgi:hypothetical protein
MLDEEHRHGQTTGDKNGLTVQGSSDHQWQRKKKKNITAHVWRNSLTER